MFVIYYYLITYLYNSITNISNEYWYFSTSIVLLDIASFSSECLDLVPAEVPET